MQSLREVCLNKEFESHTFWSHLPAVIGKKLTRAMTREEVIVSELEFSLIVTEIVYNKELQELLNVVRQSIKWADNIPKFSRRHVIMILTRLKKFSDHICHDLERDWLTERSIAFKPSKIYECLDFNLDTSFAMTCVAYCDTLDEVRGMMRRAMPKDGDQERFAISPKLNAERALLPLQRLAFHRSSLRKILAELPPKSEHGLRCQLTMENITNILDRCYEVLNSLHGANYISDIDNLIDFSQKLSSLKYRRYKQINDSSLAIPSTSVADDYVTNQTAECLTDLRREIFGITRNNESLESFNLIDLSSLNELPLGFDHSCYNSWNNSETDSVHVEQYELMNMDHGFLRSRNSILQKSFIEGPLYQVYTETNSSSGDIYDYASKMNSAYEGEHIYEEIDLNNERNSWLRTLWCETDAVIKSGLLDSLNPKEKALQESKFEIITSEVSYLKSICVLVGLFYESNDLNCTTTSEERESIFANILEVREVSEKFLYDLAGQLEEDIMLRGICGVVRAHAVSSFRVYIDYCSNQIKLHSTLKRLMNENEEFREIVMNIEGSSECHGYSLLSFLTLPMQRVTRLPLLMQAVQKRLLVSSQEYTTCRLALSALNQLVHECNEGVRKSEKIYNRENFLKETLDKVGKLEATPKKKRALLCKPKSALGFLSL